MSEQNETIADLMGELRALAGVVSNGIIVIQGDELADRIEAAWKREKSAIEVDALAVGGIVGASAVGDCAKMREALRKIKELFRDIDLTKDTPENEAYAIAETALAAPPRNCDMPLVVDGPADNNADKAWLVFKHRNPDAYRGFCGVSTGY